MEEIEILPQQENTSQILERISSLDRSYNRIRGGFPSLTESGHTKLVEALSDSVRDDTTFEWLVSIAAGITSPSALSVLQESASGVRVVDGNTALDQPDFQSPELFHPKILWLKDGDQHDIFLGSANITNRSLHTNWELDILLTGVTINEDQSLLEDLERWWLTAWQKGIDCDDEFISNYEEAYEDYTTGWPSLIAGMEETELADAEILWLEIWSTFGKDDDQVDSPTECLQYFVGKEVDPDEDDQTHISYRFQGEDIDDQESVRIQGNGMCRINLPDWIGNRYDLENYYLVLERVEPERFQIRLVSNESPSSFFKILEALSREHGQVITMRQGRECGWLASSNDDQ
jgi:HKD family nuclease